MVQPTNSSKHEDKHKLSEITKINKNQFIDYLKMHYRDVCAYILIIIGLFFLFLDPIYGGLLIGLVTGVYFSDEIVRYVLQWKGGIDIPHLGRNVILGGLAFAFFISAPAIFLGGAIAIALKQLFIEKAS